MHDDDGDDDDISKATTVSELGKARLLWTVGLTPRSVHI